MNHPRVHRSAPFATRRLPRRRGITLLEVLISLAIFLFALAAIGQLIRLAGDQVVQADRKQHGIFLCQSKLAEFAAGVQPMASQSDQAFDGDETDWLWSADCSQNITGLWQVQVTVKSPQDGNAVTVSCTRMLLDPTTRGNTMDTPATLLAGSTGSSSSTGSNSSSSSSSSSGTSGGTSP